MLLPLAAHCSPKKWEFMTFSNHCSTLLASLLHPPWQAHSHFFNTLSLPHSYTNIPPQQITPRLLHRFTSLGNDKLTLFKPTIHGESLSWTHKLYTLNWFSIASKPSKLVRLLTVHLNIKCLWELPPLNKLPLTPSLFHPHPGAAQFLHLFTPLNKLHHHSYINLNPFFPLQLKIPPITAHCSLKFPPITAHCSPVLHRNFG